MTVTENGTLEPHCVASTVFQRVATQDIKEYLAEKWPTADVVTASPLTLALNEGHKHEVMVIDHESLSVKQICERLTEFNLDKDEHPFIITLGTVITTHGTTPNPYEYNGHIGFTCYHLQANVYTIKVGTRMWARIKPGAGVSVDRSFARWPNLIEDGWYKAKGYTNPNTEFLCTFRGNYWNCHAKGFGAHTGEADVYGNGSLFVSKRDSLEPIRLLAADEPNPFDTRK